MNLEIERKFFVTGKFKHLADHTEIIRQGFISDDPERSVRIRIKGKNAFLTIKGKAINKGTTRFEFETEIKLTDAEQLLLLSGGSIIEKKRFYLPVGKHTYEVDEFTGDNKGLIIAEIELNNENEDFIKPDWLGDEITGDMRFYNLYLSKNSYSSWYKDI